MQIILRWWNWKSGREEKTFPLPLTQNGYISKVAWVDFESAVEALGGKKVRLEINKRTWGD